MKAGTEVVLIDRRGCWVVHEVRRGDTFTRTRFHLRGKTWRGLSFAATATVDAKGRRVYQSAQAAIAPDEPIYHALHLPFGWNPPPAPKAVAA